MGDIAGIFLRFNVSVLCLDAASEDFLGRTTTDVSSDMGLNKKSKDKKKKTTWEGILLALTTRSLPLCSKFDVWVQRVIVFTSYHWLFSGLLGRRGSGRSSVLFRVTATEAKLPAHGRSVRRFLWRVT